MSLAGTTSVDEEWSEKEIEEQNLLPIIFLKF